MEMESGSIHPPLLRSASLGWRHLLRERNLRSSLQMSAGYGRVWRRVACSSRGFSPVLTRLSLTAHRALPATPRQRLKDLHGQLLRSLGDFLCIPRASASLHPAVAGLLFRRAFGASEKLPPPLALSDRVFH